MHDKEEQQAIMMMMMMMMIVFPLLHNSFWNTCLLFTIGISVHAQPLSRPYVAYLTSPFDQFPHILSMANDNDSGTSSDDKFIVHKLKQYNNNTKKYDGDNQQQCPPPITAQYDSDGSVGIPAAPAGGREGGGIISPPVIFPLFPGTKSLLYLHHHELLDAVHIHPHHHHGQDGISMMDNVRMEEEELIDLDIKMKTNFPLLFQGSTFVHNVSPLIHDVNGDGIEDAILVDYDGLITIIGLDTAVADTVEMDDGQGTTTGGNGRRAKRKRYFQEYQIPRLLLRKDWVEIFLNDTLQEDLMNAGVLPPQSNDNHRDSNNDYKKSNDWFHSYFEYEDISDHHYQYNKRSEKFNDWSAVRGNHGDVIHQNLNVVGRIKVQERRRLQELVADETTTALSSSDAIDAIESEELDRGKDGESEEKKSAAALSSTHENDIDGNKQENTEEEENSFVEQHNSQYYPPEPIDVSEQNSIDQSSEYYPSFDDYRQDAFYEYYDDDYFESKHFRSEQEQLRKKFYSDDNYVYLPPHVLSSPTYFEEQTVKTEEGGNARTKTEEQPQFPHETYSFSEKIALAVSYYFDEDEHTASAFYEKRDKKFSVDEVTASELDTEWKRGFYVANALVIFDLQQKVFKSIHLDLSTDYSSPLPQKGEWTKIGTNIEVDMETLKWHEGSYDDMGAFALASPTVVDLDGDGQLEALIGTSMGLIYCLDISEGRQKFSFQMMNRIEHPIVVLDGNDGKMLIFGLDKSGNLLCLDSDGNKVWSKNLLLDNEQIRGTSDLVADVDVDGDGMADIVVSVYISSQSNERLTSCRIYALNAINGNHAAAFPIDIPLNEGKKTLDELETSQMTKPLLMDTGSSGVALFQSVGSDLYMIQSGCVQLFHLHDRITSVTSANIRNSDTTSLIATTQSRGVQIIDFPSISHYPQANGSPSFFIHKKSRRWRNVLGRSVPISFEILEDKGKTPSEYYWVDMRVGTSSTRMIFGKTYNETGLFTEEINFPFQPGFYTITARMRTKSGVVYEDTCQFAYNLKFFTDMLAWILLVPCFITIVALFLHSRAKATAKGSAPLGII